MFNAQDGPLCTPNLVEVVDVCIMAVRDLGWTLPYRGALPVIQSPRGHRGASGEPLERRAWSGGGSSPASSTSSAASSSEEIESHLWSCYRSGISFKRWLPLARQTVFPRVQLFEHRFYSRCPLWQYGCTIEFQDTGFIPHVELYMPRNSRSAEVTTSQGYLQVRVVDCPLPSYPTSLTEEEFYLYLPFGVTPRGICQVKTWAQWLVGCRECFRGPLCQHPRDYLSQYQEDCWNRSAEEPAELMTPAHYYSIFTARRALSPDIRCVMPTPEVFIQDQLVT